MKKLKKEMSKGEKEFDKLVNYLIYGVIAILVCQVFEWVLPSVGAYPFVIMVLGLVVYVLGVRKLHQQKPKIRPAQAVSPLWFCYPTCMCSPNIPIKEQLVD